MALHRDRALLLRRTPYGESSLVVHLLTPSRGRVHLLAKGAYRPTSGFFAVLDLFDTLELEWSERPTTDLGLLRAARIDRRRRRVTEDLEAYRSALAALELCDLAARSGPGQGSLFPLLEGTLDALDRRSWPLDALLIVYELRFLADLGLAPALERCAACGGAAPPVRRGRAAFSAGAGGRLCGTHADEARAAGRRVGTLPEPVLTAAAGLARRSPGDEAPAPVLSRDLSERLRDFVGRFLDYHLETRPRSHRAFLAAANRNAPELGAPEP